MKLESENLSKTCCKTDCGKPSVYLPVLLLRCKPLQSPFEIRLGIPICPLHAVETEAEDFFSDEGWKHLTEAYLFATKSKARPDRKLTSVKFIPIPKG